MRMHIELDDGLVQEIDRLAGDRGRSAFVRSAIQKALADRHQLESLEAGIGSIADNGHEWDQDPAEWVHSQRFGDAERVG